MTSNFNVVASKPRPKTEITIAYCGGERSHGKHAYEIEQESTDDGHDYIVKWKECGGYLVIEDTEPRARWTNRRKVPFQCEKAEPHASHIWYSKQAPGVDIACEGRTGPIEKMQCANRETHDTHFWAPRGSQAKHAIMCDGYIARRSNGYGYPYYGGKPDDYFGPYGYGTQYQ